MCAPGMPSLSNVDSLPAWLGCHINTFWRVLMSRTNPVQMATKEPFQPAK